MVESKFNVIFSNPVVTAIFDVIEVPPTMRNVLPAVWEPFLLSAPSFK